MAVAAEGDRRRVYVAPTPEHEKAADIAVPVDVPDTELPDAALGFRVQGYGMTRHADLFTRRQLTALTTFSDLVTEARHKAYADAVSAGMADSERLEDGGTGAHAYSDSVAVYLGALVSKVADNCSNLCAWRPDAGKEGLGHVFARQALSFVWDYAEGNVLKAGPSDIATGAEWLSKAIGRLSIGRGHATQADAASRTYQGVLVSTDRDPSVA